MNANATCKERINGELAGRIDDLRQLWAAYAHPNTPTATEDGNIIGGDMDGGHIYEFGLYFDYVAPGTFRKQQRGYFRWQLSTGGPGDEFRIYAEGSGYRWHVDRIEYVFMDWWDSAKRTLSGARFDLLEEIFQALFVEDGSAQAEFEKAFPGVKVVDA